jgi:hypothetical protein
MIQRSTYVSPETMPGVDFNDVSIVGRSGGVLSLAVVHLPFGAVWPSNAQRSASPRTILKDK